MAKITLNLPSFRAFAVKSSAIAVNLTKGIRTSVSNFAHDVQEEIATPKPEEAEANETGKRKLPFDFARKA